MRDSTPLNGADDLDLILYIIYKNEDKDAAEFALYNLYNRYAPFLIGAIKKYFPSLQEDERNQVVQEVFLKVWNAADQFDDGKGQLKTWLFVMTKRKCLDMIKVKNSNRERSSEIEKLDFWATKSTELPDERPSNDNIESSPYLTALNQVLDGLNERERSIILEFFQSWPDDSSEITKGLALRYGTTEVNIRVIKSRVLKKIREALNTLENNK